MAAIGGTGKDAEPVRTVLGFDIAAFAAAFQRSAPRRRPTWRRAARSEPR
jgi:hypothetical protein